MRRRRNNYGSVIFVSLMVLVIAVSGLALKMLSDRRAEETALGNKGGGKNSQSAADSSERAKPGGTEGMTQPSGTEHPDDSQPSGSEPTDNPGQNENTENTEDPWKGPTGTEEKPGPAGTPVDNFVLPDIRPDELTILGISNVTASKTLVVHWGQKEKAAYYQVMRKEWGKEEFEQLAILDGDEKSYADEGCTGGMIYTYQVYSMNANRSVTGRSQEMSQMAIDGSKKMIALTYDDGPSKNTPLVLDAVEKYHAHVTFFVVGNRVNSFKDSMRREAALGCEIANHTYDHEYLDKLNKSEIKTQVSKVNEVVKELTGVDIRLMRLPGGRKNDTVMELMDMPLIMWSIDTLDWKTKDTDETIKCVKKDARDGAIVLMHDLHEPTAKAADAVMEFLTEEGYQLVTVSEMGAYRGGLKNGTLYYSISGN